MKSHTVLATPKWDVLEELTVTFLFDLSDFGCPGAWASGPAEGGCVLRQVDNGASMSSAFAIDLGYF